MQNIRFDFVIGAVPFRSFIYPKRRNSGDSVAERGQLLDPFFHRQIQGSDCALSEQSPRTALRTWRDYNKERFRAFLHQIAARDLTRTITYPLVALLRQPSRSYSYPQRDSPYCVGSRGRAALHLIDLFALLRWRDQFDLNGEYLSR